MPALEPIARGYASKGVDFLFVYTREAHPGEHYPAHTSMEQKLHHARAFRDLFGVERPILVDNLLGDGHQRYGSLPNMTYFVARGGTILFRADWTDAASIVTVLDYHLAAREQRSAGTRLAPFYAEFRGLRWNDPRKFQEGLARAGPQAIDDMAQATKRNQVSQPDARIEPRST